MVKIKQKGVKAMQWNVRNRRKRRVKQNKNTVAAGETDHRDHCRNGAKN